jgi:hypothetical protein
MDYKEIQNDKIQAAIIKVETLQKEYEVTLQQYQEAGQNYISALQNGSSNPCQTYNSDSTAISQACYDKIWVDQGCTTQPPNADESWAKSQTLNSLVNDSYLWATMTDETHRKGCYGDTTNYNTSPSPTYPNKTEYTALKGRTWWGTAGITEGAASTQEECETMCANSENCSGATFNPVKKYCWSRSGDTSITTGEDDDYALIPKQKAALVVMKGLNEKLLNLNNQITSELTNINPEVEEQSQQKNTKQQELQTSYQTLLEQKLEMERQLQEYNSINEENENQSLYVTQQTVSMRVWVLITCLVLIVTMKQMVGIDDPPLSITIWLSILMILIILTYSLSYPAGFAMWFLLLLGMVLMKTGNLPSP